MVVPMSTDIGHGCQSLNQQAVCPVSGVTSQGLCVDPAHLPSLLSSVKIVTCIRCLQVAETCQLALQRIEYLLQHPDASNEESPYFSVDPTPALPASTPLEELTAVLLDEKARMFDVSGCLYAHVGSTRC